MTESDPRKEPVRKRLGEVAEDATGFGAAELRMTRDLVLDPARVVILQATPQSAYPRPLRYYLTLNALFLLLLGMLGGFEGRLGALPAELFEPVVRMSGKSLDGFMADLDQWYSLLAVPLMALSSYPVLGLLFRRWSIHDPGARGQAFTFMSGWSLWGAPFALAGTVSAALGSATAYISFAVVAVLFFRMGREVWWRTPGQLIGRFLILFVLVHLAIIAAGLVAILLAVAGAVWAP